MKKHISRILDTLCVTDSCSKLAQVVRNLYDPEKGWDEEHINNIYRYYLGENVTEKPEVSEAPSDNKELEKSEESPSDTDYRIIGLSLGNFRKFPVANPPYGIICCEEDKKPQSIVLVGRNGVGKSSLYVALEHVMRGMIGEANLRNYRKEMFVTHCNNAAGLEQLKIHVASGKAFRDFIEFSSTIQLDMDAFFCSEWDIYEAGKIDFLDIMSTRNFFLENLGFSQLLKLEIGLSLLLRNASKKATEREREDYRTSYENDLRETRTAIIGVLRKLSSASKTFTYSVDSLEKFISIINDTKNNFQSYIDDNLPENLKEVQALIDELLRNINTYEERLHFKVFDETGAVDKITKTYFDITSKFSRASRRRIKEVSGIEVVGWLQVCIDALAEISAILNTMSKEREVEYTYQDGLRELLPLYRKQIELEPLIEKVKQDVRNDSLINDLKSFISELNLLLNKEIEALLSPNSDERQMILDVMKLFSSEVEGQESLNIKLALDKDERLGVDIKIVFNEEGKEVPITPSKFYNTFRYKLFCMMLRVAVAFAIKKRENINFPLIWDDVFYASDYKNRNQVVKFISKIHKAHNLIFTGPNAMPLQFICFTHDELIIDAFHTASREKENPEMKDTIFGRLFHFEEVDKKTDLQKIGDNEFINLYYKLFNAL